MIVRSPFAIKKPVKPQTMGLEELFKLYGDLGVLKIEIERVIGLALGELERAKTIQKGDKGELGVRGFIGATGPEGEKGSKGDRGEQGLVGLPGKDGKNGLNGKDGRDGQDGKDGVSPIVADILEKLFEEINAGKRKIKLDNIEGLKNEISAVRNATMRGGGDTVAAGSGVTVTQTNGVKTISASGGGLTALTATETPNGNRTIFTFAAATAQPTYIVADNVWLKATSGAGTVNWTWNGGTLKATLTVPPADDVWGVV